VSRRPDARILLDLAERAGAVLQPGEFSTELYDGDLVAEVTVRVRRCPATPEANELHAEALQLIRSQLYRIDRCGCRVKRSGYPSTGDCRAPVVGFVVWRAVFRDAHPRHVLVVCAAHKKIEETKPEALGAFLFASEELVELRGLRKAELEERERARALHQDLCRELGISEEAAFWGNP
jgi:hypothetical protein